METNTAPMSWGRVIAIGAVSGVVWGLLLTVLLWLLLPGHNLLVLIGCGIGFGVVYGVIAQIVQYGMTHLTGVGARAASHYQSADVPPMAAEAGRPRRAYLDDEAWLSAGSQLAPANSTPEEVTQLIPPVQPIPPRFHKLRKRLNLLAG